MEENAMPSSRLDKFRQWFKKLVSSAFGAPYLPGALTAFFVITVVTNLAVIFLSQPLSYWRGGLDVKGLAFSGEEAPLGPAIMIGGWLVYLAIAVLCLNVFNYRWSVVGWLAAVVAHFYGIQDWLQGCYFSRWSVRLGVWCQSFDDEIFWFFSSILLGLLLAAYFRPAEAASVNEKAGRRVTRVFLLAPLAWTLALLGIVVWSARTPTYGWVLVETESSPGPRQEAEVAYDTKRNRLVLFGGASGYLGNDRWDIKDETWEFDGTNWINVSPEESPKGRTRAGMAYDENRGVVVMFGGATQKGPLCDTWEWDGREWVQVCPANCPSARYGHEMVYDSVRKKIVLYGGYDNTKYYNDAWEWDGGNWTKIGLEGDAPVAAMYALAYDPDKKYALGLLSGSPGGTWTLKGNAWTRLSPKAEPSNRGWMGLAYDAEHQLFVTFGGKSKNTVLNDTWLFDGENWFAFTKTSFQPSIRLDMVIWYDHVRKHVMLFGGNNGSDVYNDTWELILPEE